MQENRQPEIKLGEEPATRQLGDRGGQAWAEIAYASNEIRLSFRVWAPIIALFVLVVLVTPRLWKRVEKFEMGDSFRLPYCLGNDYWTYGRYCRAVAARQQSVPVIGDSVVWGHYVASTQTLSHYLSEYDGARNYANLGLDGIHPVAMEGLLRYYGPSISGKKVLLHCNMLWMHQPEADLQWTDEEKELQKKSPKKWARQKGKRLKEKPFNHPKLATQFFPRIPRNESDFTDRVEYAIGRHLPFCSWSSHLRCLWWNGYSVLQWSVVSAPTNPFSRMTLQLPSPDQEVVPPPDCRPWTERGLGIYPDWVDFETSFQWGAFRRIVELLKSRDNDVFVLIGPFNEHMLEGEGLEMFRQRRSRLEAWLNEEAVPFCRFDTLPSRLCPDASHPLAEGYSLMARQLLENPDYRGFIAK